MNHWDTSDRHHDNTRWLWAVLYAQIRDMAVALPTPVLLPHLPHNAHPDAHTVAAQTIERLRDTHLGYDLPADILALADRALTDTILAHKATNPNERRHLITEAQARVNAVTAYMGIGPEDVGVHDTWEETLDLDR